MEREKCLKRTRHLCDHAELWQCWKPAGGAPPSRPFTGRTRPAMPVTRSAPGHRRHRPPRSTPRPSVPPLLLPRRLTPWAQATRGSPHHPPLLTPLHTHTHTHLSLFFAAPPLSPTRRILPVLSEPDMLRRPPWIGDCRHERTFGKRKTQSANKYVNPFAPARSVRKSKLATEHDSSWRCKE